MYLEKKIMLWKAAEEFSKGEWCETIFLSFKVKVNMFIE